MSCCGCSRDHVVHCAGCGRPSIKFNGQDLEDVANALSFFIRRYTDYGGRPAPETRKAMAKLLKRRWNERYIRDRNRWEKKHDR